jgi:hypothetical protein
VQFMVVLVIIRGHAPEGFYFNIELVVQIFWSFWNVQFMVVVQGFWEQIETTIYGMCYSSKVY